jgi:hypothetical protein
MPEPANGRRVIFDETTADLLSNMQQRKTESQLPKTERSRIKRERIRKQERRSKTISLDLPDGMKQELIELAGRESIPISQLVAFLLIPAIDHFNNQRDPLFGFKKPSRCAKFDFILDLEKRQNETSRPA